MKTAFKKLALIAALCSLSACGAAGRIADIGKAPNLSPIADVKTTTTATSISHPMVLQNQAGRMVPAQMMNQSTKVQNPSLWRTGARAFFSDPRANQVGDILTVEIDISDNAAVDNTTRRSRTSSDDAGLTNFLGFESKLGNILPNAVSPATLIDADSSTSTVGNGAVERSEQVRLTVAAIVTQVLPNGNMVIHGRQEVRVNFEVRELIMSGIVRPQDITDDNRVAHTQIAEARISYGGRGQLTDMQQARYGQQLLEILMPY